MISLDECVDSFVLYKKNQFEKDSIDNKQKIDNVNLEKSSNYVVTQDRAYFYSQPDSNFKRRGYLVYGESFNGLNIQNGFIYVDFINPKGKTTSGWLSLNDLTVK